MATYLELHGFISNSNLQEKVAIAAIIKAQGLLDGATPTTDQITWALAAIQNPVGKSRELINYVLAANKGLTIVQIQGASDTAIQNNVDSAVDALITGGAV